MIGALRAAGQNLDQIFTGIGHAPGVLSESEGRDAAPIPPIAVGLDCPDWLLPDLRRSLGSDCEAVLRAMQKRAPVFLRVNLRLADRATVQKQLAAENISSIPSPLSGTALEVVSEPRRIRASRVLASGGIELQDAASQAVSDLVPLQTAGRMLDFCAGGGGKTLAVGGRVDGKFFAYDVEPRRMSDLPVRAARAKVDVTCLATSDLARQAPFDIVLVDAPCSGSGSWRRDPQGKWALTRQRLEELVTLQAKILDQASALVAPGGQLVYVTCSLLSDENETQVAQFIDRNPDWKCVLRRWFTPLQKGDGFFMARLTGP